MTGVDGEDGRRRVPGVGSDGDPGFLAHGHIDPSAAATAALPGQSLPLGEPTRELAAMLGYDLASDRTQDRRARRDALARQRELRRSGRGRNP